jgi:outer membrane protein assembly factor BamD (BamD/ComL family)
MWCSRLGWILAVLVTAALASAASGRQDFTLAEDDTWVEETAPDPSTPEGQLAAARAALAAGQYERAETLATQWIDRHGLHPQVAEAYLIRGDSLMGRRSYYAALFDYEVIARQHFGSETFTTALERELEIAKIFISGTRRKLWGLRIVNASEEAQELLIRIQERLPGSELAEEAGMTLGDYYFSRRKMQLAAEMYGIFIENYPRSPRVNKARRRLIYAHLASFKGPEFDARGLYEARAQLRELKVLEPLTAQQIGADALLTRIDESDARKMLVTAQWYLRVRDIIAAELMIRRLLRTYPRSVAARDAIDLLPRLIARLPEQILAEAPDYAALIESRDVVAVISAGSRGESEEEE